MLMRRESGSRTVQKFASQRGKQEVTKKGKSTAEVACMAIIRLMLPLFCQLISISPRVTGDNRLLHHPPAAPRRGSLPWQPAPAQPATRGAESQAGARDGVRHGEHTGPAPPGGRVCKKGRPFGESSPTVPPPRSAMGTRARPKEEHTAAPRCYLTHSSPVATLSPRTAP